MLTGGGAWKPALEACSRVSGAAPRFTPALRLGAVLQARLDQRDGAIADLRAALLLEPDDFDLLADLARLLFETSRFEELDLLLRERAARGSFPETLDRINAMRLRALSGPLWAHSFSHETERYRIVSDIDIRTCRDTARVLEDSLKRFEARLRPAPRGGSERLFVYVFSGQASYLRYASDAMGSSAEHTADLYHRGLRQLVIWNSPSRTAMLETTRHEALHQYMHRLSDDVPARLNEGLAECYENAQRQRGPSEELQVQPGHMRVLSRTNLSTVGLERFLHLSPAQFYADAAQHYAQAWALTHFLLSSGPTWRRCLDRMLDKLVERAPAQAVVQAGFDGVDLGKFLADHERHIDGLRR